MWQAVPRCSLFVGAVLLNAVLLRDRLESVAYAAMLSIPLLRLRSILESKCTAGHAQTKGTVRLIDGSSASDMMLVWQFLIYVTLACVLAHCTSIAATPLVTILGACTAAFQIGYGLSRGKNLVSELSGRLLSKCPREYQRVVVASLSLSIVGLVVALIALPMALVMYMEAQKIAAYQDTLLHLWPGVLGYTSGGSIIDKAMNMTGIEEARIKDSLKTVLLIKDFVPEIAHSSRKALADIRMSEMSALLQSKFQVPLRIAVEMLPLLYYVLAADIDPWTLLQKIGLNLGIGNFTTSLIRTIDSILMCTLQRVVIYAMLGFVVAMLSGLSTPVLFAAMSASHGLTSIYPPEILYGLVALWIGLVQGRVWMMVLILSIAIASAWITTLTIHAQVPNQNKYWIGLCVIVGLQRFGLIGILVGPLIGSLPMMIMDSICNSKEVEIKMDE